MKYFYNFFKNYRKLRTYRPEYVKFYWYQKDNKLKVVGALPYLANAAMISFSCF